MAIDAGKVKKFALEKGASLAGVADAEHMKQAPEGHRPTDILADAKTIVVIATPQARALMSDAPPTEYTRSTFSCEAKLEIIAHDTANFLDESGYKAVPVPVRMSFMLDNRGLMGDLSHKHSAVFAGLGQMGKNSLLITPEYGLRCYLSSIVTDAPLEADSPFKKDFCEDCVLCIDACPVKAISRTNEGSYLGNKYVEKHRCYAYCKTQVDEYPGSQGLYTCRACRTVCPYSK
jgi:epoxyqueuosine reductase QueG